MPLEGKIMSVGSPFIRMENLTIEIQSMIVLVILVGKLKDIRV